MWKYVVSSLFATAIAAVVTSGCGEAARDERIDAVASPIVGGTEVTDGKYPAVGALVSLQDGGATDPLCTGVLLDETHVLTAAHCVALEPDLALGFTVAAPEKALEITPISSVEAHPDFTLYPKSPSEGLHDIALLTLSSALSPATFASLPTSAMPTVNEDVVLVGFGPTSSDLSIVDFESEGVSSTTSVMATEFVVASSPSPQTCFGDSGGPALSSADADGVVVGLASRSAVDGDRTCTMGAVYTRVDAHAAWIEGVLRNGHGASVSGCSVGVRHRGPSSLLVALFVGATLARRRRLRAEA